MKFIIFLCIFSCNILYSLTLPSESVVKTFSIPVYQKNTEIGINYNSLFAGRHRFGLNGFLKTDKLRFYADYAFSLNGTVDNIPFEEPIKLTRHSYYAGFAYNINIFENDNIILSVKTDGDFDKAGELLFWQGALGLSASYKRDNLMAGIYANFISDEYIFVFSDYYISLFAFYDIFIVTASLTLGFHTYDGFDTRASLLCPIGRYGDAFVSFRYYFSMPAEWEASAGLRFSIFDFFKLEGAISYFQIKGIEFGLSLKYVFSMYEYRARERKIKYKELYSDDKAIIDIEKNEDSEKVDI